jgi:simple sugar transport system ATP-binding protein
MMIGRDMPHTPPAVAMPAGEKRLELTGLTWQPDDPFAMPLSNVNLSVRAGEIVGIAGISGNGQSELAALISGEAVLPAAQAKQINMMGKPAGHLSAAERRRLGFAFVPEDRLGRGAVPEMPLVRNSVLTAHPLGLLRHGMVDMRAAEDFTKRCITDFDVRTPGPGAEAGSLSGGNLQKFIVGREIMLSPKLLFLAQPTWGVDIGAAAAIRQRLMALRNEGVAILVISEEIEELFELADVMQVLRSGTLSERLVTSATRPEEIGRHMIGATAAKPAGAAA